ncbi:MAG: class I SAM-dependent methyltransferase [Gemmatimonadetes bacterium]|nr:class I SAM-dependent methyltransferase [Gemmatimonadota bacterium]
MRAFAPLPARERWFVRARLFSAPLAEMAARVPPGLVLDIGCGHGALVSLMATDRPDRTVLGVDPDPRKVAWASASVGRLPNVQVREGTGEAVLPAQEAAFDAVVVADVLYLLPVERWEAFLATALRLLKPGGVLLLEEAEGDRSWRHLKWTLQEFVMVRVLRRTRSSGGLALRPRSFTEDLLRRVGFDDVRSTTMSAGYTTPHLLMEARRPAR